MAEKTQLTWRDWLIFAAIFLLAAGIRAYPEIRSGYWPIGYDTLNSYLPALVKFDGNIGRWIFGSDLFYLIVWPIIKIFDADPSITLKVAGCVLYGGLAGALYLFVRKFLNWGILQSFLVGLLFMIQLPALRMSWDLFRNMLALIFLLPALYCLYTNHKVKNLILLLVFSFLIVLSNPLVAGLWFVLVAAWLIYKLWNKDWRGALLIFLSVLPTIVLFFLMLKAPTANSFGGRVFSQAAADRVMSYFTAYTKTSTYDSLALTITTLFWFYFSIILGPALYGFWLLRKNILLTSLVAWLLVGTFSSLAFGGFGLFVWDRWMIMLVLPFTIYAVAGLWDLGLRIKKIKFFKARLVQIGSMVLAVVFWLALIGVFVWKNFPFVSVPSHHAKPPYLNSQLNAYLPPSMINNSVGFENMEDILQAIEYLNAKAVDSSVIVIDSRYLGILLLRFDFSNDYIYSYPWSKRISQKTLGKLKIQNIGPIYTIWTHTTITGFERVFKSGEMNVYRDIKTFQQYE